MTVGIVVVGMQTHNMLFYSMYDLKVTQISVGIVVVGVQTHYMLFYSIYDLKVTLICVTFKSYME